MRRGDAPGPVSPAPARHRRNVAGRRIRTLLDQELEAGQSGDVSWDGTDDAGGRCASGIYFFRVAAPGWREERKVVVLR